MIVPVIIGSVAAVPVIIGSVAAVPVIIGLMVMVAVTKPFRPGKYTLTSSRAVTDSPMVRVCTKGENPPNESLADSASDMLARNAALLESESVA